jgi:hypothetical protein
MKERAEDVIHQCLECHWCIHQAERHEEELEQPLMCAEDSLLDVVFLYPHLMIARLQIQLGEEDCHVGHQGAPQSPGWEIYP